MFMHRHTHLLTVFFAFAFHSISTAQEGTITIDKDPRLNELLEVYHAVNKKTAYYQIQVGFRGNNSEAKKLRSQVELDFPGWYTTIDFKEPTYRVKVGKFKTRLEAERRYLQVRRKYPDAMLLKPEQSLR